jgi:hypothetical protein
VCLDFCDGFLGRELVGHIECHDFSADRLGGRLAPLGVDIVDHHAPASLREHSRCREAYAARSARDDSDAPAPFIPLRHGTVLSLRERCHSARCRLMIASLLRNSPIVAR